MTAAIEEPTTELDRELAEFSKADAAIAELTEKYSGLTIPSLSDTEAVTAVVEAHKEVKKYRVDIEKKRKEIKAPALQFGKDVDKEAKRLTSLIEPLETHLDTERDKVRAEEKRLKEEEERLEKERLQNRVDQLTPFESVINLGELSVLTDDQFADKLREEKQRFENEQEAKKFQQQLAEYDRDEELSVILPLSTAERKAMLQQTSDAWHVEQDRRKKEEAARVEREAKERAEREQLEEQNRKQQEEIERLKATAAAEAPADLPPAGSLPTIREEPAEVMEEAEDSILEVRCAVARALRALNVPGDHKEITDRVIDELELPVCPWCGCFKADHVKATDSE